MGLGVVLEGFEALEEDRGKCLDQYLLDCEGYGSFDNWAKRCLLYVFFIEYERS